MIECWEPEARRDWVLASLLQTHLTAVPSDTSLKLTLDSPVSCQSVTLRNDSLNLISILELNFSELKGRDFVLWRTWGECPRCHPEEHIFCASSSLFPQSSVGSQPVPDAQRYQAFKIHVMKKCEERV